MIEKEGRAPDGQKEIYRYWDLRSIAEDLKLPQHKDNRGDGSTNASASWSGTESLEQAIKLCTQGDPEHLREIETAAEKLRVVGTTQDTALTAISGPSGACVDIEKFLLGDPNCMSDFVLRQDRSRIVRIMIDYCASSGTSSGLLIRRGVAIFEITRALELAGYSVELNMVQRIGASRTYHQYHIAVKQAGEYLDPAIVAFWLCNPSAQRRIGFRLSEIFDTKVSNQYGYGHVCDPVLEEGSEHVIYLPLYRKTSSYSGRENMDAPQTTSYMLAELKKRNIELSA